MPGGEAAGAIAPPTSNFPQAYPTGYDGHQVSNSNQKDASELYSLQQAVSPNPFGQADLSQQQQHQSTNPFGGGGYVQQEPVQPTADQYRPQF